MSSVRELPPYSTCIEQGEMVDISDMRRIEKEQYPLYLVYEYVENNRAKYSEYIGKITGSRRIDSENIELLIECINDVIGHFKVQLSRITGYVHTVEMCNPFIKDMVREEKEM